MTALITVRSGLVESVDGFEDVVIVNFDVTELSDPETVREEIGDMEACRLGVVAAHGPDWLLGEIDSCISDLWGRLGPQPSARLDSRWKGAEDGERGRFDH